MDLSELGIISCFIKDDQFEIKYNGQEGIVHTPPEIKEAIAEAEKKSKTRIPSNSFDLFYYLRYKVFEYLYHECRFLEIGEGDFSNLAGTRIFIAPCGDRTNGPWKTVNSKSTVIKMAASKKGLKIIGIYRDSVHKGVTFEFSPSAVAQIGAKYSERLKVDAILY